eukprot:7193696-Ditylum_brightwellii.AAC.1
MVHCHIAPKQQFHFQLLLWKALLLGLGIEYGSADILWCKGGGAAIDAEQCSAAHRAIQV